MSKNLGTYYFHCTDFYNDFFFLFLVVEIWNASDSVVPSSIKTLHWVPCGGLSSSITPTCADLRAQHDLSALQPAAKCCGSDMVSFSAEYHKYLLAGYYQFSSCYSLRSFFPLHHPFFYFLKADSACCALPLPPLFSCLSQAALCRVFVLFSFSSFVSHSVVSPPVLQFYWTERGNFPRCLFKQWPVKADQSDAPSVAVKREHGNKVPLLSDPDEPSGSWTIKVDLHHMCRTSNLLLLCKYQTNENLPAVLTAAVWRDNQYFSLSLFLFAHNKKNALILSAGMNRRLGTGFRETGRWFWSGFHRNLESVLTLICWAPFGSSRCGERKKETWNSDFALMHRTKKPARPPTQWSTGTCSVMLLSSNPSFCNSAGGQCHWQCETLRSWIIMGAAGFFFFFFFAQKCLVWRLKPWLLYD